MKAFGRVMGIALGLSLSWQGISGASVANAVPLSSLMSVSDQVVVATVTSVSSHYEKVAGSNRIVTDTTLQVDHVVAGDSGLVGGPIVVRTLGGTVGDLAQLVLGEAVLAPGTTDFLFLRKGTDGRLHVSAMAQGEYIVVSESGGALKLRQSPGLDVVVNPSQSAVAALAGRTLEQAEAIVAQAGGKVRKLP